MQEEIKKLEIEIENLKKRNKKVEAEKAWEISNERKILIIISTYIIISIVMYLLNFEKPLLNAIIPTCWYILSTLSISFFKNKFIEKWNKNYKM